MHVRIQLIDLSGQVLAEHVQDACRVGGWETGLGDGPVVEGADRLLGFTYLPLPPPHDAAGVREFRRLWERYLSG